MADLKCLTTAAAAFALPGLPGRMVYVNTSGPSTVTNTTAETILGATVTVPTAQLNVGTVLRVTRYGFYTTTAVAPTLTGNTKINGATMLTTGPLSSLVSVAPMGWWSETNLMIVSAGGSGTATITGRMAFSTAATVALMLNPIRTTAMPVDTTADLAFSDTVKWGTASPSNVITVMSQFAEVFG